jgi:hypothetical protein
MTGIDPELRRGHHDAERNGVSDHAADDVGGREQAEAEADQDVVAHPQGKADELSGIEGRAGLPEVDIEQLAEGEGPPEQPGDALQVAVDGEVEGAEARGKAGYEGQDREQRIDENAADQLALAALAAKAVDQHTPAQPRDGVELRAGLCGGPGGGAKFVGHVKS